MLVMKYLEVAILSHKWYGNKEKVVEMILNMLL